MILLLVNLILSMIKKINHNNIVFYRYNKYKSLNLTLKFIYFADLTKLFT